MAEALRVGFWLIVCVSICACYGVHGVSVNPKGSSKAVAPGSSAKKVPPLPAYDSKITASPFCTEAVKDYEGAEKDFRQAVCNFVVYFNNSVENAADDRFKTVLVFCCACLSCFFFFIVLTRPLFVLVWS